MLNLVCLKPLDTGLIVIETKPGLNRSNSSTSDNMSSYSGSCNEAKNWESETETEIIHSTPLTLLSDYHDQTLTLSILIWLLLSNSLYKLNRNWFWNEKSGQDNRMLCLGSSGIDNRSVRMCLTALAPTGVGSEHRHGALLKRSSPKAFSVSD